jgi:hypothetical protein
MIIEEIRRQNLRRILEEDFGGSQAELARKIGKKDSAISRVFMDGKNRRNIGAKFARTIETAAGKPKGWLDVEHIDPEMLAKATVAVDEMLAKLRFKVDPLRRAKLIAIAYEDSMIDKELKLHQVKLIIGTFI